MDLRHKGIATRTHSPRLWGNAPIENWALGIGGYYASDDFRNFSQHITDQHTQQYASYIDTGVTIKQNENQYGVLEVAGNDADNDEGSIQAAGADGAEVYIDDGTPRLLIFEFRAKKASVSDNALAFFCGLAAPGFANANALVDDTGAVKDDDFIGFSVLHDNGEELDFTYKASGQTVQVPLAALASLSADTFFNAGFILNPNAPPSKRITVFYNNTEQTTYVTQTNIEAATFPKDVALARALATKVGAAAESKFQMDWWAVGSADA